MIRIYGLALVLLSVNVLPEVMASDIAPCPDKPNCVSSKEKGQSSYIEPLRFSGELAAAKEGLVQIINQQARTQVIRNKDDYLHTTFTSLVFRFVDDVEFWFDDDNKVIHVRSASRKGYYDFGANRRRVEFLRTIY